MQVEQAVFTSARSRKSQGYHLVGTSPGVTESMARVLSTWGPSHASLLCDDAEAESFNFHRLDDNYFAISRTVHGGAEYSGRAGLQVFTRFLIANREQLAGYDNNPLELAQTALALGILRLSLSVEGEQPVVDLPDRSVTHTQPHRGESPVALDEVRRIIAMGARVAIIGLEQPLPILALLLEHTPPKDRLDVSFTTGLRPSIDRTFQVQFAHRPDSTIFRQLADQGVDHVTAS